MENKSYVYGDIMYRHRTRTFYNKNITYAILSSVECLSVDLVQQYCNEK